MKLLFAMEATEVRSACVAVAVRDAWHAPGRIGPRRVESAARRWLQDRARSHDARAMGIPQWRGLLLACV